MAIFAAGPVLAPDLDLLTPCDFDPGFIRFAFAAAFFFSAFSAFILSLDSLVVALVFLCVALYYKKGYLSGKVK